MCLDTVTKENTVAKNDIVVWKAARHNLGYNSLTAPWVGIEYKHDNIAKDMRVNPRITILSHSPVKPGFCLFRKRRDAMEYLSNNEHGKIIKCYIPKGTEVSHGRVLI